MRADMDKVLVERPRLGRRRAETWPGKGYRKKIRKYHRAGNAPPAREGMKDSYGHNIKHFNEHLGPLRRFLNANVGRPWDAVYSEVCRCVNPGNVVQSHILTHLFQYVEIHTILIDGQPCRGEGRNYGDPLRTTTSRDRWYVCPKSGLLRKSKYTPYARAKPVAPRLVRLNNKQVCVDRGDRWELISVVQVTRGYPPEAPAYDAVLQRYIEDRAPREGEFADQHGRSRYAVYRRVLSRRELRGYPIPIEWMK